MRLSILPMVLAALDGGEPSLPEACVFFNGLTITGALSG
jgi:hypothetical protein